MNNQGQEGLSQTGQRQSRFHSLGGTAVAIDGKHFWAYFQHSCHYTILGGSRQLVACSFATYYLDALSLTRVLTCPQCAAELSLHSLDFIDSDPLFRYRYEMPQQDLIALLHTRAKEGENGKTNCGKFEEYTWSYQPLYSLERFDRQQWRNWYAANHTRLAQSEIFTLQAWLIAPWLKPVVIAEQANREADLWLGASTLAITSSYARLFIPAFVGRRNEAM